MVKFFGLILPRFVALIKAGHDVSSEARDKNGEWSAGGASTAAGGAARIRPGDPHPTLPHLAPSSAADRARVKDLGGEKPVPPSSWGLSVDDSPGAKNVATFFDLKGRKQYIRSSQAVSDANAHKFESMTHFAAALPKLRRRITEDLATKGTSPHRACAAIIRLVDLTTMRIGSEEYAEENGTYGASSLRREHVSLKNGIIYLRFKGKHSQDWAREIEDAPLYGALQAFTAQTSLDDDDALSKVFPVNEMRVRAYLKEFGVSPKQFRTYQATFMAAKLLRDAPAQETEKDREKVVTQVCKTVSEKLGNTAAVCRSSYINPAVINDYLAGTLGESKWSE